MQPKQFAIFSAGLLFAACAAFGQTPAAKRVFDVATIRPAPPLDQAKVMSGQFRVGMSVDGNRVDIRFFSLSDLIRTAYKVKQFQISGPDWMSTDRWEVQAKMPDGATKDDVPEMLQALLVERFKLQIHRDSKEQSVYGLIVGKGGPKLKPSPADAPVAEDAPKVPSNQLSFNQDSKGVMVKTGEGATRMSPGPGGTMHIETDKMSMEKFAEMLSGFVDRPVVDQTELKGNYQVALDISMDDLRNVARKAGMAVPMGGAPGGAAAAGGAAPLASDPSGPTLFNAVQQLGLKLEPKKTPVETIVVDHLEKTPTEN
jgi:uncharacterized protein (TIGR03435 family)